MISARRASMESVDGSGTSGENAACGAALREIHPWPVPLEGPAHAEFSPCGGGEYPADRREQQSPQHIICRERCAGM